jgi:hypothetical protein
MSKIGVGICGRKRGEIAQKCANYKEMVSDGLLIQQIQPSCGLLTEQ